MTQFKRQLLKRVNLKLQLLLQLLLQFSNAKKKVRTVARERLKNDSRPVPVVQNFLRRSQRWRSRAATVLII